MGKLLPNNRSSTNKEMATVGMDTYQFANLSIHPEMVQEIEQLERKFKQELGETITLIAFASKEAKSQTKQ